MPVITGALLKRPKRAYEPNRKVATGAIIPSPIEIHLHEDDLADDSNCPSSPQHGRRAAFLHLLADRVPALVRCLFGSLPVC